MAKRIVVACWGFLLLFGVSMGGSQRAAAQMLSSATPNQGVGSSFFEQSGVRWSIRGPNFFANFGGGAGPPFGNPGGSSGLRSGLGFNRGGISGSLGFQFAQGSSTTINSTTASVTAMDGYPGSIQSGTLQPFVTGINPVVGGYSYGQPSRDNASSQLFESGQRAQASELRQRMQANWVGKQRKAAEAFQRGLTAESEGNLRMARANYRRALAEDQGPLRLQILQRMNHRGWK